MVTTTLEHREKHKEITNADISTLVRTHEKTMDSQWKDIYKLVELKGAYDDLGNINGDKRAKAINTFIEVLTERKYTRFDAPENIVNTKAVELVGIALMSENPQIKGSASAIRKQVSRVNSVLRD
jgi:hypothetical protein